MTVMSWQVWILSKIKNKINKMYKIFTYIV
jgi:hypothetical protein